MNIWDTPKQWLLAFFAGCAVLLLILGWFTIFGPLFNRAAYNSYNNSSQHVNAVAQRFADDCEQIAETSDPVAKKAIEQDIYEEASTVDVQQMQMPDGVRVCVDKALSDVSGGK